MRKVIEHFVYFFLVFMPLLSYGQNFELEEPNKVELRKSLLKDNSGNDIIYHYLINNYKPLSEKTNIQKLDYDESRICAFIQSFEFGIKFSVKSCEEARGQKITIEFPKIDELKIKNWIEKIYEADLSQIPNEWYTEKNIYGPVGGEAGCYYKLKATNEKWIIENYCGC